MIIQNKEVSVSGRLIRIARLRHEWFDFFEDPYKAINEIRKEARYADALTFLQDGCDDNNATYPFHSETTSNAVLPITTYQQWWKSLDPRVRNKIRKTEKHGVELRDAELTEDFVQGVEAIFNESPLRQGKRFWHYGKKAPLIKEELSSFLDRSYFVGAYFQSKLIGFMKLFRGRSALRTIQIIATLSHRDKAVQDSLIARAVQMCEEKSLRYLHYGSWSKGGLGDFKAKRGFVKMDCPRYYVPLTFRGKVLLELRMHHSLKSRLPEQWINSLVSFRARWNRLRYGDSLPTSN